MRFWIPLFDSWGMAVDELRGDISEAVEHGLGFTIAIIGAIARLVGIVLMPVTVPFAIMLRFIDDHRRAVELAKALRDPDNHNWPHIERIIQWRRIVFPGTRLYRVLDRIIQRRKALELKRRDKQLDEREEATES